MVREVSMLNHGTSFSSARRKGPFQLRSVTRSAGGFTARWHLSPAGGGGGGGRRRWLGLGLLLMLAVGLILVDVLGLGFQRLVQRQGGGKKQARNADSLKGIKNEQGTNDGGMGAEDRHDGQEKGAVSEVEGVADKDVGANAAEQLGDEQAVKGGVPKKNNFKNPKAVEGEVAGQQNVQHKVSVRKKELHEGVKQAEEEMKGLKNEGAGRRKEEVQGGGDAGSLDEKKRRRQERLGRIRKRKRAWKERMAREGRGEADSGEQQQGGMEKKEEKGVEEQVQSSSGQTMVDEGQQNHDSGDNPSSSEPAAVWYRGAPWQQAVGQWLQDCQDSKKEEMIEESLFGHRCPSHCVGGVCSECSGNGVCNHQLGTCQCRHGFKGPACSEPDQWECNLPATATDPFGRWTASICPAFCDKRTALCFCGPGTKHPYRSITHPCGFIDSKGEHNYSILQHDYLYNNETGYCNADVSRPDASQCGCEVDGMEGRLCSTFTESFCINQCSLNGDCLRGYCQCRNGWYGIDCSVPSAFTAPDHEVPLWKTSSNEKPAAAAEGGERTEAKEAGGAGSSADAAAAATAAAAVGVRWGRKRRGLSAKRGDAGWGGTRRGGSKEQDAARRDSIQMRRNAAAKGGKIQMKKRDVESSGGSSQEQDAETVPQVVMKPRPLIYVYDLPGEFSFHNIEARKLRMYCATRSYGADNHSGYTFNLYGMEVAVLESLLSSRHRTTNGDEADFFYVPVLGGCITPRADDTPRFEMQTKHMGLRQYFAATFYERALHHIQRSYPFWNRTGGRDHIWNFPWDEGACAAPGSIWPSIMLSHWGNTMSHHGSSTTGYGADNWDNVPKSFRGDHPCFDPLKDIVMPSFKPPNEGHLLRRLWTRPLTERSHLFYFNGNLGAPFPAGRPEPEYSMGIRQKVAAFFSTIEPRGNQSEEGVVVIPFKTGNYGEHLSSSRFCGVFPGDGFSARMEDSMLHGCIPVIIQDGIQLPFENFLDYGQFAVRISEADIPNMISILKAISESQVQQLFTNVQQLWMRWYYRGAILLESNRQQKLFGDSSDWEKKLSDMEGDDAVDTLIQVLGYKLKHDPWRLEKGKKMSERC